MATKHKHLVVHFLLFITYSFWVPGFYRMPAINLASSSAGKSGNLEEYAPYVDFNDSSDWKRASWQPEQFGYFRQAP
jgi:hypothetical protein